MIEVSVMVFVTKVLNTKVSGPSRSATAVTTENEQHYQCTGLDGRYKQLFPKVPCRYMVHTWALQGLLYFDFGAHVCTITVLGPLGLQKLSRARSQTLRGISNTRPIHRRTLGNTQPLLARENPMETGCGAA